MARSRKPTTSRAGTDVDAALATMAAPELRELVGSLLAALDAPQRARFVGSLVSRAARSGSGWAPAPLEPDDVGEVIAFMRAAKRVGHAEPADVDERLQRGSAAFLGRDYGVAREIFDAILPPIGDVDVDLGQDEMLSEVLGTELDDCASQYVVATYMITTVDGRAEAVFAALERMSSFGSFDSPLRDMERVAVEPLPEWQTFLEQWRELLGRKHRGRSQDWAFQEQVREVCLRLEGPEGLATIARETRQADDLRAWCDSLVAKRAWKAALPAFEEAARIVVDEASARGEFLDGAALAAMSLERRDLAAHLERAWRLAPTSLRLRRWLGTSTGKPMLRKRVAEALVVCPQSATRQRALLCLLGEEFTSAADLLTKASGLGWSDAEHPGNLVFPLFARLLGSKPAKNDRVLRDSFDLEELLAATAVHDDEPVVPAPEASALLEMAGITRITDPSVRSIVLAAMKTATLSRLEGVTNSKRRRHYAAAADLVATCIACDPTNESALWAETLKTRYSRYPGLRAELDTVTRTSTKRTR